MLPGILLQRQNEDIDMNAGSSISIAGELNKSSYTFTYYTLLTEQTCIQNHVKRLT